MNPKRIDKVKDYLSQKLQITDSGYFKFSDAIDVKYTEWSRAYEYPYIMKFLEDKFPKESIKIHNTCCGGHHIDHVNFLKDLELKKEWFVLNSDLNDYAYEGYIKNNLKSPFEFYDITKPFDKKFDVIINVSTLEEIPHINYIDYFQNSYNQLNLGGYLIITCDVPPANLYDLFDDLNIFNESFYNFAPLLNKPNDALNFNNTLIENAPNPGIAENSGVFYLILQRRSL